MSQERGMSIADVMTAGGNGIPREITRGIKEDVYYPNHEAIDFITATKKIFNYSKALGLKCLCVQSIILEPYFFQPAKRDEPQ